MLHIAVTRYIGYVDFYAINHGKLGVCLSSDVDKFRTWSRLKKILELPTSSGKLSRCLVLSHIL